MLVALLGTIILAAGAPQDTEQMRVTPMSEAEAVSEFENACFRVRDPDALAGTAIASARHYVEGAPAAGTAVRTRSWSSPYGSISYVERRPGHDGKGFRECSFTAYTRDSVNRFILNRALADMVARRAASHLVEIEDPAAMGWVWRDEKAYRMSLYSLANSRTPHQITLSLRSEDRTQ